MAAVMTRDSATPRRYADFRCALVLGLAGALSVLAVLPYALALLPPETLAKIPPKPVLYAAQTLQGAVMFTLMAWAGLTVGRRIGLGAPWLASVVAGAPRPADPFPARLVGLAAIGACLLVLLMQSAAQAWLPPAPAGVPTPSPAQGFLASFYGGIGEELQLRLFLMTLLAWVLLKFGLGRTAALALANLLAALAFGAGHLPMA